jgi:hypothetical protein
MALLAIPILVKQRLPFLPALTATIDAEGTTIQDLIDNTTLEQYYFLQRWTKFTNSPAATPLQTVIAPGNEGDTIPISVNTGSGTVNLGTVVIPANPTPSIVAALINAAISQNGYTSAGTGAQYGAIAPANSAFAGNSYILTLAPSGTTTTTGLVSNFFGAFQVEDDTQYTGLLRVLVVKLDCYQLCKREILNQVGGTEGVQSDVSQTIKSAKADVVEAEFDYAIASEGTALLMQAEKLLADLGREICDVAASLQYYNLPMCKDQQKFDVPPFQVFPGAYNRGCCGPEGNFYNTDGY